MRQRKTDDKNPSSKHRYSTSFVRWISTRISCCLVYDRFASMRAEHRPALYQRLLDFSVDSGGEELTFAARLARENGWTPAFTNRVMLEYKRFLFLAKVVGHPVTPSDQVDQAWHLHLTYTRSYWDKLCGEVLEMPLHHGPTRGGEAESRKFDDWYNKTLESYRSYFGEEPPADIWPPSSVRFGEDLHYQRVNTKRNWLFPVPRFLAGIGAKPSWAFIFCAVIAVAIASTSFVSGSGDGTSQERVKTYMAGVPNTVAVTEDGYQSAATHVTELERDKLAIEDAKIKARSLNNKLNTLSAEIERKKQVLDRRDQDAVDSFNREVNEYNTLVESLKAQDQQIKLLVSEYNEKVEERKNRIAAETLWRLLIVLFFSVFIFLRVWKWRRCPKCKAWAALRVTDRSPKFIKHECNNCDHSSWDLKERSRSSGGGGCGGG
jgi:hypothetical protein